MILTNSVLFSVFTSHLLNNNISKAGRFNNDLSMFILIPNTFTIVIFLNLFYPVFLKFLAKKVVSLTVISSIFWGAKHKGLFKIRYILESLLDNVRFRSCGAIGTCTF
jgi:hypothetical protein